MKICHDIRWIPPDGLDRELDWLKNMGDWMISKKRFWGLALPIWVDEQTGEFEVIGSKEELKARAVEGWDQFEGKSPHRPWLDLVKIRNPKTGNRHVADRRRGQSLARRRDRAVLDHALQHATGHTGNSGSRPISSRNAFPASSATGFTPCWP